MTQTDNSHIANPRERITVQVPSHGDVKLPRNFSWLIPLKLAGMSVPTNASHLHALKHLNISLIVTLMEQPLPSNVTCSAGIEPLWIETQNYHAPPLEGIETALQRIEEVLRSGEGGIVVHCAGGKGRAGTLLACYMCKWGLEVPPVNGEWCGQGMNAGDAIKLLRKTRPGSIESVDQEQMVKRFKRKLWEDYQTSNPSGPLLVTPQKDPAESFSQDTLRSLHGFPSISHLPFSPEMHSDDTMLSSANSSPFVKAGVIITEKMDGGNCCIRNGEVYARTHTHPASHDSFGPIKALSAKIRNLVPKDIYLFGENMTGIHSIEYTNLTSPFYLFAVYDPTSQPPRWWSWDDIAHLASRLSLPTVPVLYHGTFQSMSEMESWMTERMAAAKGSTFGGDMEGFVIRPAGAFVEVAGNRFENVAKYVRKGHVQTDEGWRRTWRKAKIHYAGQEAVEQLEKNGGDERAADVEPTSHMDDTKISTAELAAAQSSSESFAKSTPPTAKEVKAAKEALKRKKQQAKRAPRFVILVGLPGSGKSTFAKQLEESPGNWIIISQDTLGSHSACESLLNQNLRKAHGSKCRILIDRCNVSKQDRQEWLDLMMRPDCTCVFFDVDKEVCKERVAGRSDHPTIPMGKGAKIVESFAKRLERPEVGEGFRSVVVVRRFEEGETLGKSWGA